MLKRAISSLTAALLAGALIAGCGDDDQAFQEQPGPNNPKTVITIGGAGAPGNVNGARAVGRFNNPVNVETDGVSTLYVTDFSNNAVRKIVTTGEVSTVFGNNATFERPFGITLGKDNNLYVQTDTNNLGARNGTTGTIWRINPNTGAAAVVVADVGRPRGLCTLSDGRIVLSDLSLNTVSLLNVTSGVVTPLAGEAGVAGNSNGTGTAAHFNRAYGPAVAADGSILLADQDNNVIRRVTLNGEVTTFAGTGVAGFKDGSKGTAQFNGPQDVSIDAAGNIFVADNRNSRIRQIDPQGNVTTLAGTGVAGFKDGGVAEAQFFGMEGIAALPGGHAVFVADGTGGSDELFNRVRAVLIP